MTEALNSHRYKPFGGAVAQGADGYVRDHSTGKFAPGNRKGLPKGYKFKKTKARENDRIGFTESPEAFMEEMLTRGHVGAVLRAIVWAMPFLDRLRFDETTEQVGFGQWPHELSTALHAMLSRLYLAPKLLARAVAFELADADVVPLMLAVDRVRKSLTPPSASEAAKRNAADVPTGAATSEFDAHFWAFATPPPSRGNRVWSILDGEMR